MNNRCMITTANSSPILVMKIANSRISTLHLTRISDGFCSFFSAKIFNSHYNTDQLLNILYRDFRFRCLNNIFKASAVNSVKLSWFENARHV